MELTRDNLLAKKAELKAAYDKALAEQNAFGGAMQFCDFLLAELDKGETQPAQLRGEVQPALSREQAPATTAGAGLPVVTLTGIQELDNAKTKSNH
jgi:hypothetical protein